MHTQAEVCLRSVLQTRVPPRPKNFPALAVVSLRNVKAIATMTKQQNERMREADGQKLGKERGKREGLLLDLTTQQQESVGDTVKHKVTCKVRRDKLV